MANLSDHKQHGGPWVKTSSWVSCWNSNRHDRLCFFWSRKRVSDGKEVSKQMSLQSVKTNVDTLIRDSRVLVSWPRLGRPIKWLELWSDRIVRFFFITLSSLENYAKSGFYLRVMQIGSFFCIPIIASAAIDFLSLTLTVIIDFLFLKQRISLY